MARYLIVHEASGEVTNAVLWDGQPGWSPPEGHIAIENARGQIGMLYDAKTGTYSDKPVVPTDPPKPTPTEKIVDLLVSRFALSSSDKEALLTTE